jgi:purine-nucleoside phosphorylase
MSEMKIDYIIGKTWTTDAFYRETKQRISQRLYEGCLTVEMEFTALAAVAKFRRVEFAEILYCGDDLSHEVWDGREWNQQDLLRKDLIFLAKKILEKM